jgi:hypothetical protein
MFQKVFSTQSAKDSLERMADGDSPEELFGRASSRTVTVWRKHSRQLTATATVKN